MISPNKLTFLLTAIVIGFTPLDAIEIYEGSGITLGRYFFIAMAASAAFSGDLIIKKYSKIFKLLLIFIFWAFMTTLWSVDMELTLQRNILLIQYAIIFSVMVNVLNTPTRIKIGMAAWIVGASYIAYKTITDFQTMAYIATDKIYRVSGYGNPNENSFILCYALIFTYVLDNTRQKIPSVMMTFFSAIAIAANGSRMGIILLIIAVCGFFVQLWQNKKRWYVFAMIPVIIFLSIYVIDHLPKTTLMRILGITQDIEAGSFANRENIWAAALQMLSFNPEWLITGCGWGAFPVAITDFLGYSKGAHNFYLDLLVTTGVIGLLIVVLYLYRLFILIRHTSKTTVMNYLILILPMISMISTNWQSRRWWFLMGAFIYLIYKSHNLRQIDGAGKLQG